VEAAKAAGKHVLVWIVADDYPWTEKKELGVGSAVRSRQPVPDHLRCPPGRRLVGVLAIARKVRNQLIVGKERLEL
jgi:hypothetical protein